MTLVEFLKIVSSGQSVVPLPLHSRTLSSIARRGNHKERGKEQNITPSESVRPSLSTARSDASVSDAKQTVVVVVAVAVAVAEKSESPTFVTAITTASSILWSFRSSLIR